MLGVQRHPRPAPSSGWSPRCARRGASLSLASAAAARRARRGGRAVEGARLESVYGGNSIVGSNPTPSATLSHWIHCVFFLPVRGECMTSPDKVSRRTLLL